MLDLCAIDCWVNVKVVSRQRAEEYYVRPAREIVEEMVQWAVEILIEPFAQKIQVHK